MLVHWVAIAMFRMFARNNVLCVRVCMCVRERGNPVKWIEHQPGNCKVLGLMFNIVQLMLFALEKKNLLALFQSTQLFITVTWCLLEIILPYYIKIWTRY